MKRLPTISRMATAALLAVSTVTILGCDTTEAVVVDETPAARAPMPVEAVAHRLSLSPDQEEALQASIEQHRESHRGPGFLWYVAADLQEELTDEQKEQLAELLERPEQLVPPAHRLRPRPLQAARHHGPRLRGLMEELDLSEDQQAALDEIGLQYRRSFRGLVQSRRDGDMALEDFHAELHNLHTALRHDIETVLTDEQKQVLREKIEQKKITLRERREQVVAVRNDALNLTPEQTSALDELEASTTSDIRALLTRVKEGDLEPIAARQAVRELREQARASMAEILTDEQMEVVQLHRALVVHFRSPVRPGAGLNG